LSAQQSGSERERAGNFANKHDLSRPAMRSANWETGEQVSGQSETAAHIASPGTLAQAESCFSAIESHSACGSRKYLGARRI
jgi:hypothetical protein